MSDDDNTELGLRTVLAAMQGDWAKNADTLVAMTAQQLRERSLSYLRASKALIDVARALPARTVRPDLMPEPPPPPITEPVPPVNPNDGDGVYPPGAGAGT